MNVSTSQKEKRPWWVPFCSWVRKISTFLTVSVILDLVGNVFSTWLTSSRGIIPADSPLAWLVVQWHIMLPIGCCLLLVTILTGVLSRWPHQTAALSTLAQQNRTRMLERLRCSYKDQMVHSLQGGVQLELALAQKPDAVHNATNLLLRGSSRTEQRFPVGTSLVDAYDEAGHEVLLLGEPGAGKSTLLRDLAQELVERAKRDEMHPLPIILSLSSWAIKRSALQDWLSEQLTQIYDVPRRLSVQWVREGHILPLLDGLDEVNAAARLACITAINTYHRDHLEALVVCSRKTEYEALPVQQRLTLLSAVIVQPLTQEQVDACLIQGGKPLAALRSTLKRNCSLQELARTPLMLGILMVIYSRTSVRGLLKRDAQLQQQLWTAYVERMVERKGDTKRYPLRLTHSWLSWLAQQMRSHNQTVFYLEQLQTDWLPAGRWKQIYERCAVQLVGMLIGAFVGLLAGMSFLSLASPYISLYVLISGLVGWLLTRSQTVRPLSNNGSWTGRMFRLSPVKVGHVIGILCIGLLGGLVIGLVTPLTPLSDLQSHLLSFAFGGALLNVFLGKGRRARQFAEMVAWFWMYIQNQIDFLRKRVNPSGPFPSQIDKDAFQKLEHLCNGGGIGLIVGLSFGLGAMLSDQPDVDLKVGAALSYGLSYVLSFGLVGVLLSILLKKGTTEIYPAEKVIWSWKSLQNSITSGRHVRNAALAGLIYWFSGTLIWLAPFLLWKQDMPLWSTLSWDQAVFYLSFMLSLAMAYWLLLGFLNSVSNDKLSEERRIRPNHGIWLSAQNSGLVGLMSAFVSGLSYALSIGLGTGLTRTLHRLPIDAMGSALTDGLSYGFNYLLSYGLIAALIFGLSVGLLCGLLNGGWACLQHLLLRLLLWRSGSAPWNYPHFLDDAAKRLLLWKEGGGYSFRHQLLLDYFVASAAPHHEED